jgi:GT2 family glycosyltransferase
MTRGGPRRLAHERGKWTRASSRLYKNIHMASLTVVLGTINRRPVLRKCLEALIGGTSAQEIVVVDAGSTDGTLEYLASLKSVRIVCDGKLTSQAESLNRVFRTIKTDYVCWLSDDNVVLRDALDLAVSILEEHPDVGMVALKTRDVVGPGRNVPYIGGIWMSGVLNCNQGVLRTELLHRVGGFDERFGDYGIDADLTTAILLTGHKVVYTKAVAIHHYRHCSDNPWISREERKRRAELAKQLYRRKYDRLIKFKGNLADRIQRRINERSIFLIEGLFRFAHGLGVASEIERCLGLGLKDFQNLFRARFISSWDFVKNRNRPYYLVQAIPESARIQMRLGNKEMNDELR